jgi:cellulose synthase/poly-beta-1,6-N-acetylglucosamine synthase-like glycosyltransferase
MHSLLIILIALSCIELVISLSNYFFVRVITPQDTLISRSIAILIPMRNEEKNAHEVIQSSLSSTGLTDFRIRVLDDASADETPFILTSFGARIETITGHPLENGWLGKPFACSQLAAASKEEYLVFIDADVRLSPQAISASISAMEKLGWDFLSPYPAEEGNSLLMKLVQPLLQWSWLTSVPLRFAESGRRASMIIANGQFFIVKRSAYEAINGHSAVRNEILEDLSIARLLAKSGYKGGVAEASAVARCRMYESNEELIAGYTKSLWKAFGGPIGTLFTIALLLATQILPILLIVAGYPLAIIPFAVAALTHLLAARRTRSPLTNTITHPIAVLALISLIAESYRRRSLGTLEWRGRRVN